MRIMFDLRSLANENRTRGIGIYTANLIAGLGEVDQDNHYLLVVNEEPRDYLLPKHHELITVPRRHPIFDRFYNRALVLPKLSKLPKDLAFQPDLSYGLPKGSRTIGTVYDFIELDFPLRQLGGAKQRLGRRLRNHIIKTKFSTMLKASALVTISNFTKTELLRRYPSQAEKPIAAIPLAASADFAGTGKQPLKVPKKPFLLYVGGADERKDIPTLIESFTKLRQDHDCQLVLIGKDFTDVNVAEQAELRQLIKQSQFASDIICPGFLPESEVIWYYHQALALAFPSKSEGFGLEVLEAMTAGCPVVCFNTSSLPEVAGRAALLVNSNDEFLTGLRQLFDDPAYRNNLINLGKARASQFSWRQTAQETLKFMMEVAR